MRTEIIAGQSLMPWEKILYLVIFIGTPPFRVVPQFENPLVNGAQSRPVPFLVRPEAIVKDVIRSFFCCEAAHGDDTAKLQLDLEHTLW